jgi:hypothetical protein
MYVPQTGIEPVAYRLGGGRSIRLSYWGQTCGSPPGPVAASGDRRGEDPGESSASTRSARPAVHLSCRSLGRDRVGGRTRRSAPGPAAQATVLEPRRRPPGRPLDSCESRLRPLRQRWSRVRDSSGDVEVGLSPDLFLLGRHHLGDMTAADPQGDCPVEDHEREHHHDDEVDPLRHLGK